MTDLLALIWTTPAQTRCAVDNCPTVARG